MFRLIMLVECKRFWSKGWIERHYIFLSAKVRLNFLSAGEARIEHPYKVTVGIGPAARTRSRAPALREQQTRSGRQPPPLELLDRLAALVPPPRVHRHRYFGVLAPNSPLRTAVIALALAATTSPPAPNPQPAAELANRRAARYAWALLLARIYEVFPLVCLRCGGEMRIIAFITNPSTIRDILLHLGEPTAPPRIAPARGPPLCDLPDAGPGAFDPQPAPEYEFDQRVTW